MEEDSKAARVEKAEKFAAALLAQEEAKRVRQAKRAAGKTAKDELKGGANKFADDIAAEADSEAKKRKKPSKTATATANTSAGESSSPPEPWDVIAQEKVLNVECAKAKAAHLADPSNAALAASYSAAKAAFREHQQAKMARVAVWRCEICKVSMPESGKALHENGKTHKKRAAASAAVTGEVTAAAAAAANQAAGRPVALACGKPSPLAAMDPSAWFECRLCGCTGARASQPTHASGKKHQAKLSEVLQLWKGGSGLKAGDWVCVQHGWHAQLNYASKDMCHREGCEATKADGLSYEEVRELERADRQDKAARAVVRPTSGDLDLSCRDCESSFTFTAKEQAFYAEKGYAKPSRCLECRSKKRQRQSSSAEA